MVVSYEYGVLFVYSGESREWYVYDRKCIALVGVLNRSELGVCVAFSVVSQATPGISSLKTQPPTLGRY